MAKDFPEDKYDFRLQKDERTFAENLLHVAAVNYDLIGRVSGSNIGPTLARTGTTRRATFTRGKPTW